LNHSAIEGASN